MDVAMSQKNLVIQVVIWIYLVAIVCQPLFYCNVWYGLIDQFRKLTLFLVRNRFQIKNI